MRHLVYLLLVANVVFLGWNLFETHPAGMRVHVPPPLPDNVTRLMTLQEQQSATASNEEVLTDIETLTMEQPPVAGTALV